MSAMSRETPWACRDQALLNAIIHLWPPCRDVAGVGLSEIAPKWSSLMQDPVTFSPLHTLPRPYPTLHFNEPHLQGARMKGSQSFHINMTAIRRHQQLVKGWNKVWGGEKGNDSLKEWKEWGGGGLKGEGDEKCLERGSRAVRGRRRREMRSTRLSCSLGNTCTLLDAYPCCGMKGRGNRDGRGQRTVREGDAGRRRTQAQQKTAEAQTRIHNA